MYTKKKYLRILDWYERKKRSKRVLYRKLLRLHKGNKKLAESDFRIIKGE